MRNKIILTFLSITLSSFTFIANSVAQEGEGSSSFSPGDSLTLPVHFDFHYLIGQGETGGNDGLTAMESKEQSFGLSIAFQFFDILLVGIGYDSMSFAQTEAVDDTVGNVSGSVTSPFTPLIGAKFMDFTFKFTMHMFGEYELDKSTALGNNIEYGNISGNRIELLYQVWWPVNVGLYSQTLAFSESFDTGLGKEDLSTDFEVSQTGFVVSLAY